MKNNDELKGKTPDEMKEMVGFLKKELFNLRFQKASGELSNTTRFRDVKRQIARIKTFMNQPPAA